MKITLVVAVADNGVIGNKGGLPWRLSADLKHFKAATLGRAVVMGRRTFESIGRPLPERENIVVTRDRGYAPQGVSMAYSLEHALATAQSLAFGEAMVIGGAQIYAEALPRADRILLTEVHAAPEGDTRFPDIDRAAWRETARQDHPAEGEAPAYSFVTLERISG